jgi:methylmalonyl-CoA mutase
VRDGQIVRLKKIRATRDGAAVTAALAALTDGAKTGRAEVTRILRAVMTITG